VNDAAVKSALPLLKMCFDACVSIKRDYEKVKTLSARENFPYVLDGVPNQLTIEHQLTILHQQQLEHRYVASQSQYPYPGIRDMDQSISQLPIEDIEKAIRVMREVEKSGTMDEIRLKSNDLNMKYISNQTIKILKDYEWILAGDTKEKRKKLIISGEFLPQRIRPCREITLDGKNTFILDVFEFNKHVSWISVPGQNKDILNVYPTPDVLIRSLRQIASTKEEKESLDRASKDSERIMGICAKTNESRVLGTYSLGELCFRLLSRSPSCTALHTLLGVLLRLMRDPNVSNYLRDRGLLPVLLKFPGQSSFTGVSFFVRSIAERVLMSRNMLEDGMVSYVVWCSSARFES
jgi:hypothetical protein